MMARSASGLTPSSGGSGQIESTIIVFMRRMVRDLECCFRHKRRIALPIGIHGRTLWIVANDRLGKSAAGRAHPTEHVPSRIARLL
jgi:hypothetical protein